MTTEKTFTIVDATPPADTPKLLLVMDDTDFSLRNPGKGFYLRIALNERGDVDIINFDDCHTLPQAVRLVMDKGYEVKHWMRVTSGRPSEIPTAIIPKNHPLIQKGKA